jgi:glycosyltransferase involved in cell wall biosynthesis
VHVAIYMRSLKSARGAERVAANLARGLASRQHQVDFLVEEDGAWLLDELRANCPGVRIVNLRDAAPAGMVDRGWLLRTFAWALWTAPAVWLSGGDGCLKPLAMLLYKDRPPLRALIAYMKAAKPHAALSFLNYPNIALLLAARMQSSDTRIVVSVRNHMSVAAANLESNWVRSVPRLMRRLFRFADAVVAPSRGVADDVTRITGLNGSRVSVVYNPVFRPELPILAAEPVDHRWLADGNEPVVIGSGKFKPQKDFPTLLKAFARVRSVRAARLLILGSGRDGPELRALADSLGIGEDVDFPGHVENPFAYYGRASLFVLSSVWEGLPNALIEAMACGCPVVSTDCPSGPDEILDGGRFGPLVPVGDSDAMAAAILRTLEAPPARAQMTERARAFSLDQAVSGFEAVLAG